MGYKHYLKRKERCKFVYNEYKQRYEIDLFKRVL